MVSLSPLRRRQTLLLLGVAIFLPWGVVIIFTGPDLSEETAMVARLAELQLRLQHLDAMHRARQEEVRVLSQHLGHMLPPPGENGTGGWNSLSPEAQVLLHNMTGPNEALHMPSVYHFLPHLLTNPGSLRPAFQIAPKLRHGVSVVLGVPTVKREVQTYLLATLHNLIHSMAPEEQQDTLIIVFVAETDRDYVEQVAREIEMQFSPQVESGLIEIVSPPASYYPDLANLTPTLGDSPERFRWRTKQNLDFAFLMMLAQPRGTFYVQLEDDILAKQGFLSAMKGFALRKIAAKEPWFVIEFCQLGFIGKMFKCVELPWLVQFFLMFYTDKPVDWLLEHLISTKICSLDKDAKHCKKAKTQLWIHYKPSLFQHIGTHSSLRGKVQKLKDKHFGKLVLFYPHTNPPVTKVTSAVTAYKQHTLARAYAGEDFFWGLAPQPGDTLVFSYHPPISLSRYVFRSGNAEHPSDKFYNTTIEILPASGAASLAPDMELTVNSDGFVVVGHFDSMGVAEGYINPKLWPVRSLRLYVHTDSENWAILNEISIEMASSTPR